MKHLAALALLLSAAPSAWAQTRPPHPIVFDDFAYADRAALLSPVQWTNLDGRPAGAPERAWFAGNWDDLGAGGDRITFDAASHLRLQSFSGDYTEYGQPHGPPLLTSGFTARTGTWVARVRLADLTAPRTPFLAQAFWVASPHYASYTPNWDRKHASELNSEWNNYFYTPRADPSDPSTALDLDVMMSNGATIDGECNGDVCAFSQAAVGGYFMANPRVEGALGLTCYRVAGGVYTDIGNPETCVGALMSDWAYLMMQYDGLDLTWAAAVWTHGQPGDADGVAYYMERKVRLGRRAQPMTTVFSQVIAGRNHCASAGLPESACTAQRTVGFSVDWFLYTPDTTVSLWDAVGYAGWLKAEGLSNVNTVPGLALSPATAQPPRVLLLEPPIDLPDGSVREWAVVLPPSWDTPPGTWYDLSYRVSWRARSQRSVSDPWTPWSAWTAGGFTARPLSPDLYRTEVEVEVHDWHGPPGAPPMRACIGTLRGVMARACEPND